MILFFLKIWTSVQASHITARDRLFAITRTAASTAFAWQDIAIMVPIAGVCILHHFSVKEICPIKPRLKTLPRSIWVQKFFSDGWRGISFKEDWFNSKEHGGPLIWNTFIANSADMLKQSTKFHRKSIATVFPGNQLDGTYYWGIKETFALQHFS